MKNELTNVMTNTIEQLEERCRILELDNRELNAKNERLTDEVNFFRSLFPNSNNNHLILKPNSNPKFEFDLLLNEYEMSNKNEEILTNLFKKFPEKRKNILHAIKNDLPKNIEELANIFDLKKDLKLILISNEIIKEYEKTGKPIEKHGMQDFINKYIDYFNAENKTLAYRCMEQVFVLFPLTYKEHFLDMVQAYKFDDFDTKSLEIYEKLYGEKTPEENKYEQKRKRKRTHIDYNIISIPNLINHVKNKVQRRQYALGCLEYLKKVKRSNDEISQFVAEINNYLDKKIVINNENN